MDIKPLIDRYTAYDLWANGLFMERFQRLTDDVLDHPVKSSFPSLRATLLHIRDAQCVWYLRMSGQVQRWPAEESTAIATWMTYTKLLHDLIRSQDLSGLLEEVAYVNLKGVPSKQQRWEAFMHGLNHASYHRGQLVTMMHQLDLDDVPSTDLVRFQRS
jgi:uncharacterized damage-inducible protein DinB